MSKYLIISVRFLDGQYHGLTAHGEKAEWPPSPFRLFQALIAGNACGPQLSVELEVALTWLEGLPPPIIIAPSATEGLERLTFVINNYSHKDSKSRAPKTIRPMLMGEDRLIQYVWGFDEASPNALKHAATIADSSKKLRCLGWGIDLAIGNGAICDAAPLAFKDRHEFRPAWSNAHSGTELRVPASSSLFTLKRNYEDYINRYRTPEVTRIEAAPIFEPVFYISGEIHSYAVFKLIEKNEGQFPYPHAKLIHVARMVRRIAIDRMKIDPPSWMENLDSWINRVVHGKRDESSSEDHRQFSYVPLPSIGATHSDALIRNVMIVAPLGMERELEYLAERINGELLNPEAYTKEYPDDPKPPPSGRIELERFNPPPGKFIERCYLAKTDTWQTVTPVILPGHDDHKPKKTEKLIQRALRQSGIDTPCEFAWQSIPFLKNTLSAHKPDAQGRRTVYFRPPYLARNTAVHLRIRFGRRRIVGDLQSAWMPAVVTGPFVIGAGRHCGFGLFAACATC